MEKNMERIILSQENYSVKEIYQDFYTFLAEHFTPLGSEPLTTDTLRVLESRGS